jgi:hypothetical protein
VRKLRYWGGLLLVGTSCGARSDLTDGTEDFDAWGGSGAGSAVAGALGHGVAGLEPIIDGLAWDGLNIAVSAGRVYWTSGGQEVWGCDIGSCLATVKAYAAYPNAPFASSPQGVAVDEDRIYWANLSPGTVMSCPLAGCGAAPSVLIDGLNGPRSVAVDASHVYWAAYEDSGVFRCPKAGCSGAPEIVALNQGEPDSLALDDTDVFFVNTWPNGAVVRAAKDGSGWVFIAEGQSEPVSVAVDAAYVYWTSGSELGTVQRCPKAGCVEAPEVLASNQQSPWAIAVDESDVFWTGRNVADPYYGTANGLVMRCPLAGCEAGPTVLAYEQFTTRGPRSLALDSTHVYWVTTGLSYTGTPNAAVMRVPK